MTHCDPSPSPFEFYFGPKLILSQGEAQRSGAEIFSKRPKTRTSSVSLPTVYNFSHKVWQILLRVDCYGYDCSAKIEPKAANF